MDICNIGNLRNNTRVWHLHDDPAPITLMHSQLASPAPAPALESALIPAAPQCVTELTCGAAVGIHAGDGPVARVVHERAPA